MASRYTTIEKMRDQFDGYVLDSDRAQEDAVLVQEFLEKRMGLELSTAEVFGFLTAAAIIRDSSTRTTNRNTEEEVLILDESLWSAMMEYGFGAYARAEGKANVSTGFYL